MKIAQYFGLRCELDALVHGSRPMHICRDDFHRNRIVIVNDLASKLNKL